MNHLDLEVGGLFQHEVKITQNTSVIHKITKCRPTLIKQDLAWPCPSHTSFPKGSCHRHISPHGTHTKHGFSSAATTARAHQNVCHLHKITTYPLRVDHDTVKWSYYQLLSLGNIHISGSTTRHIFSRAPKLRGLKRNYTFLFVVLKLLKRN